MPFLIPVFLASHSRGYETEPLLIVETPRRFAAQQASFVCEQTGRSLP